MPVFPNNGPLRVNPLALVLVAALAAAGVPTLGPTITATILSIGLLIGGGILIQQRQRALGIMFMIAALAIVAALLLRGQ